jgi:hypothetical protein
MHVVTPFIQKAYHTSAHLKTTPLRKKTTCDLAAKRARAAHEMPLVATLCKSVIGECVYV